MNTLKYYTSFIQFITKNLIAGSKIETTPLKLVLHSTLIKNKKLAFELEMACKKDGFLTFSEYMQICQFGEQGFYKTHKDLGMTTSYLQWAKPLADLAKKLNIMNIIEFGCGDGRLGAEIIKEGKIKDFPLNWTGIEKNILLHKTITHVFKKRHVDTSLLTVVESIKNFFCTKKSLLICSYSVDSIPPEIFINLDSKNSYPTDMIGIVVANNNLSEVIISEKELQKKGILLKNGIYKDKQNLTFNLRGWHLKKFQRAYICIPAIQALFSLTEKIPEGSYIAILDEFKFPQSIFSNNNYNVPSDLEKYPYNRNLTNIKNGYKKSGELLLAFFSLLSSYKSALKSMGFTNIQVADERLYLQKNKFLTRHVMGGTMFCLGAKTKKPTKTIIMTNL